MNQWIRIISGVQLAKRQILNDLYVCIIIHTMWIARLIKSEWRFGGERLRYRQNWDNFLGIYKLVIVDTTAAPVMQSAALFLFANYFSRYRMCWQLLCCNSLLTQIREGVAWSWDDYFELFLLRGENESK